MLSSLLAVIGSGILAISGFFGGLIHPVAEAPSDTQAAAVALPSGVSDTITISNASGTAQTNYPYQFGRPFVQGEIKNYPQVLINGTAAQTQADVKNRYPDGSVKFAVISVIVPNIPTSGAVTLSFQNQTSGNNTPLSASDMLNSKYDFDAAIKLASGGTVKSASARDMLQNGDYTYWAQGPVATTIVLQDNSTARKYDLGFDSLRPIHPQFEATFWPSINKVYVRVSGMDWNSTALEDVKADLAITLGDASPKTVYTNPGLVMTAASGWTKEFWIGGAPEQKINIDNNILYLAATKYLPNFDGAALKSLFKESTIANAYSTWLKKSSDIYQGGEWTIYMPQTGGRSDIGLYTSWDMWSLITGDWRYRTMALTQANLAVSWPWNVVEGDPSKKYDEAKAVPALGLPVSVFARPNDWFLDSRGRFNTIFVQGARITPPLAWIPETAHHPDAFSVSYMTTGDPFYLQELQNWAAATALKFATCDAGFSANCGSARSSNPPIVGISDQIRGNAWVLRTRARAGIFSVDGTPQQNYFTTITNQALAVWDGQHDVSNSSFAGTVAYQKGATIWHHPVSPLHFFDSYAHQNDSEGLWQDYFLLTTIGQVKEYGYKAGPLLTWFSKVLTGQFNEMPPNGTYEIKLLGQYYSPAQAADDSFYTSWQQVQAALGPDEVAKTVKSFNTSSDYARLATAAAAMIANEPGGAVAWNWLNTNVRMATESQTGYRGEPEWNILPRSVSDVPLPPPPVYVPPATTTPATTTPPTPPATTTPPVAGAPLKSIAITGDFSQTSTCATAGIKTPCTFTVVFKPAAAGTRTGALSFTDSVSGKAYKISLSGTGVAATTTNPKPPATTTPPVVTPPPATSTLTGTAGNDTLNLIDGIHAVDGKGGVDTVVMKLASNAPASYYRITQNVDGSYTVKDIHASGYTFTAVNVEKILFPNKQTVDLAAGSSSGSTGTVNPHNAAVLGTDSNDALTITKNQHSIDGKGGYDVVFIDLGRYFNSTYFSIKKNADGSYTAQDVHATGYKVTLWNVEELKFNSGKNIVLSTISQGLVHSFFAFIKGAKIDAEVAFQGAGRQLALLLTGGEKNLAATSASITVPSVSFGSVTVGQTAAHTLTISFGSGGITAIK